MEINARHLLKAPLLRQQHPTVFHPLKCVQKLHVEIKPATGCSSRSAAVVIAKHQLAALVFGAYRVPERERVAAFLSDPATHLTSNPFAASCAATARHVWTGRAYDWRVTDIETTGLTELVSALTDLPAAEPLSKEITRSGAIAAFVILTADRARVVGVVIYGKAGVPPPSFVACRPRRRMVPAAQLDQFAGHC